MLITLILIPNNINYNEFLTVIGETLNKYILKGILNKIDHTVYVFAYQVHLSQIYIISCIHTH